MCICGAWSHLSVSLWDSLFPVFPLLPRYATLFCTNTHVEMPLCRGSRREDVYKIARNFRLRDQGGWAARIHAIFVSPGGVGHGGVVFSYKPRTPDSGGGWPWGGHFQLQTTYSRFRRGVGHGGCVFSYKPCTSDSRGGVGHGGGHFQLQTTYFRFRRKKPVQRALISGASRLNGCTDFPDGGEVIRPDPGTLAQDPPARPFSGPRKARFDAPGADFSASLKKSGEKRRPRPVFSAPGGGWPWGVLFQLQTTYF